jgi:hypothetical protein
MYGPEWTFFAKYNTRLAGNILAVGTFDQSPCLLLVHNALVKVRNPTLTPAYQGPLVDSIESHLFLQLATGENLVKEACHEMVSLVLSNGNVQAAEATACAAIGAAGGGGCFAGDALVLTSFEGTMRRMAELAIGDTVSRHGLSPLSSS